MKINETLNIPPAILDLSGVTASEKMLLALYATEPNAINFRALRVLGVGPSGLKKIKRRLLAKGLLKSMASGYQTLVPGLMPAPEEGEGHLVPNPCGIENTNKVAPPPARLKKEQSLIEMWDSHVAIYEQALRNPDGYSGTLHMLSQEFLDFVTKEVRPDCPGRDGVLATLTARRDYWFAASYAADNLPRKSLPEAVNLMGMATPKQLARFKTAVEQAKLNGTKPVLLLEQFSSEG